MTRGKLFLAILTLAAATAGAAEARTLQVTAEFQGPVDAQHPIWIFVWDTPDFNGAIPIGAATLDENGKTASFDAISATTVYVTVAYDEKGGYNPQLVGGPPPSGTPVSAYLAEGATGPSAIELKEGEPTSVRVRFDGTFRMP